jgi:hypothetical protein
MGKFMELTGIRFGRLTVIEQRGRDNGGCVLWLCKCDCKTYTIVNSNSLSTGNTKSCGCLGQHIIAEIGNVYGRLTVISRDIKNKKGIWWLCSCSCGNQKVISGAALRNRSTRSCGCLKKEINSIQGESSPHWKGGRVEIKGYIHLHRANHPNAKKDGYVSEHVYVMSQIIGRPIEKGETIHHKNGIKTDNSPENLELRISNHGQGQRIEDLVPYWKKMLALYEPIVNKLTNA